MSQFKSRRIIPLALMILALLGVAALSLAGTLLGSQTRSSASSNGPGPLAPAGVSLGSGQSQAGLTKGSLAPHVIKSVKNDKSAPLRSITPKPFTAQKASENEQVASMLHNAVGVSNDPVVQAFSKLSTLAPMIPAPSKSFEGVRALASVDPPDTVGDVGPNNYVQMTNGGFEVWDKNGTPIYGPAPNQTLWDGFGGVCENRNDGDPIVLYDQLADRWFLSQFAAPDRLSGGADPNGSHECVAISVTGDPAGEYYRYDFLMDNYWFYDYPHFGVWPDGYYGTFNVFDWRAGTFVAGAVTAMDRDQMLIGAPANVLVYLDPDGGGALPSDLDGYNLPPAGAPNMVAGVWSNDGRDRAYNVKADWANQQLIVSQPFTITEAPWTIPCGFSRACVPEAGGENLDAVGDRFMHRLAYRNFGTYQSWVTNHTVQVTVTNPTTATIRGVRWLEVTLAGTGVLTPGTSFNPYQQGTYIGATPNTYNRWMGSIAQDKMGNMALGYSLSNSTVYPAIYYTGRLFTDTLGTMPQGEASIILGSAGQVNGSNRWGDYSSMNVDVDDCTFWYTNEYYQVSGFYWQTRIGRFKYANCSASAPAATATTGPSVTPNATRTTNPSVTPTATAEPTGICNQTVITGSIGAGDPTLSDRPYPDFNPSECGVNKAFPGVFPTGGTPRYDLYTFYNPAPGPVCVYIHIYTQCNRMDGSGIFSAAYLAPFDSTNLTSTNYLGDMGMATQNDSAYAVTVPGNTTFQVYVSEYVPGNGCPGYTLKVSCGVEGGTPTPTATTCSINYPDVDQYNPFYKYIQCLSCRGIVSGFGDGTFRPNASVTRGQASKMIANAAGFSEAVSGQHFPDVNPGDTYYTYIERLAGRGLIGGYPDGMFHPNWPITRGQLAKIDSNAAGFSDTPPAGTKDFADVNPGDTYYIYIERLARRGIINGYKCGVSPAGPCTAGNLPYYLPNVDITRGQTSKIVANTFFPVECAPGRPSIISGK